MLNGKVDTGEKVRVPDEADARTLDPRVEQLPRQNSGKREQGIGAPSDGSLAR